MSGRVPLFLVDDQLPFSGIGTYTAQLYRLLRARYPDLRWLDLHYREFSGPAPPGAERPAGLGAARRLTQVPSVRRQNREMLRRARTFAGSGVHVCGTDYAVGMDAAHRIATVHDYYRRRIDGRSLRHPGYLVVDLYQNRLNRLLADELRGYDAVVVPSDHVRAVLRERLGLEAVTIPIPVDRERFRPRERQEARRKLGLAADRKILLNVGAATWNKNLGTLERIVARLPPEYLLVKVGAPLFGLGPRVVHLPRVTSDLYPLYFNAADGYLQTSREEGFGIPVLEALASGLPVVAAPESGAPEILGDLGFYTSNPFDVASYLEQIGRLNVAPEPTELERRSSARLGRFSESAVADAYGHLYERVFR